MARMLCKCGETLSTSEAPNDVQLRVYTDKEWDDMINIGKIDSLNLHRPKYDIWRCPKCERIYVFGPGYGEPLKVYTLEKYIQKGG